MLLPSDHEHRRDGVRRGAALSSPTAGSDSLDRRQLELFFGIAVAVSLIAGLVPGLRFAIYPFALFSTWAHEMGHGLGALITGNRFVDLELYRNLGGVARIGGADGISQVIVSSLGLLGPAILGAGVMIAGSRARTAPYVLAALAASVGISLVFWVRNLFGFIAMLMIGIVLALIARFGSPFVRIIAAQVIAVQLALSAWSTRDYLFIDGFERDGRFLASDTQKIADELFLPYWFWGGLIGGLSIVILAWAFWRAWIRPQQPSAAARPGRTLT